MQGKACLWASFFTVPVRRMAIPTIRYAVKKLAARGKAAVNVSGQWLPLNQWEGYDRPFPE
ncbi:hypothetical protein EDM59_15690 [Brevibacillus nitrificans]|uniref:Uncharacterized protein n=1 Tax=Brevibacillus nitrificans TaxID=651560 RepID=A0A3M8D7X8_9BACL|nr:hypothetical protein EDM59_15690 [Brevibacillus nitrificans]